MTRPTPPRPHSPEAMAGAIGRAMECARRPKERDRLYLTDRDRYRVWLMNATVVHVVWDDAALVFRPTSAGRHHGRRQSMIPLDAVAAVSSFAFNQRAAIRWVPLDQCYRAKHQPQARRWVHPYQRVAA